LTYLVAFFCCRKTPNCPREFTPRQKLFRTAWVSVLMGNVTAIRLPIEARTIICVRGEPVQPGKLLTAARL
jgi:hypothetical protein